MWKVCSVSYVKCLSHVAADVRGTKLKSLLNKSSRSPWIAHLRHTGPEYACQRRTTRQPECASTRPWKFRTGHNSFWSPPLRRYQFVPNPAPWSRRSVTSLQPFLVRWNWEVNSRRCPEAALPGSNVLWVWKGVWGLQRMVWWRREGIVSVESLVIPFKFLFFVITSLLREKCVPSFGNPWFENLLHTISVGI
jgi:hypothetical protein